MSGCDLGAQQEKRGSHVFSGQCGKRKASITAKRLQAYMLEFWKSDMALTHITHTHTHTLPRPAGI